MIKESYFERLRASHIKYWYFAQPDAANDIIELAREISKYTDSERKVTRILNVCRTLNILSLNGLLGADIDEIAKARNIGPDAVNIIRQIKGLPVLTETDIYPFAKVYRVYFYNTERGGSWHKDFHTLKELSDYFNGDDECLKTTSINYISEIKKGDEMEDENGD